MSAEPSTVESYAGDRLEPIAHHHGPAMEYAASIGEASLVSSVVAAFFAGLLTRRRSPWLIIVIRFQDDPLKDLVSDDFHGDRLAHFRRLFTGAGTGTMNMVDFFLENSHGRIDVSDSRVVGVYTIGYRRADYVGNGRPGPGQIDRGGALDAGRAAAAAHGITLADYSGVVVCGYTGLDLCGWVGGMAALCDRASATPDLLGQEMGHGYGLDHSRVQGSTDDYQDPWDTMSTRSPYSAPHPEYGLVGPGLNAWNMRMRGWLNEDRVIRIDPGQTLTQVVELGPLHDRGRQAAAIDVGGRLVELRLKERWDAGIPRSCVLVHSAEANHSYLERGVTDEYDLVAGSVLQQRRVFGDLTLTVLSIDEQRRRATIRVEQTVRRIPVPPEEVHRWPDFPRDPGPVERAYADPRILRLRDRLDRHASALALGEHFANPDLILRSLGELAEEIGRQASQIEVTTYHHGFSYEPDRVDPATEREPHLDEHPHE